MGRLLSQRKVVSRHGPYIVSFGITGTWLRYIKLSHFDHFVLRFILVSFGVGGAVWVNIVGICKVSAIASICWVYSLDPMDIVLWCMHNIWMAWCSILGSICNYDGIICFSYMMVSIFKCVMTCKYGKGPLRGSRLSYQIGFVVTTGRPLSAF